MTIASEDGITRLAYRDESGRQEEKCQDGNILDNCIVGLRDMVICLNNC